MKSSTESFIKEWIQLAVDSIVVYGLWDDTVMKVFSGVNDVTFWQSVLIVLVAQTLFRSRAMVYTKPWND